jgi:hypothetical protein
MKKFNFYKKKKGSSSIMVILVMLTLVVFGVLALMSSYSDLKLSKKNANWLKGYYELDARGEELVSQIDTKLEASAEKALIGNKLDRDKYVGLAEKELNNLNLGENSRLQMTKNADKLLINMQITDKVNNLLAISLEVTVPDKYNNSSKETIKYSKVVKWEQKPQNFKYDNTIQLWDGEVNKP